ncbi:probable sucrose-phosphate synthase 5 isoform X3 [Oryza glaberrima]|uniref:probable sucrose-phosphate synthase 5 isoform X3 n=1 Tax=Oryza glaberrima TaxID=4538 RepID=UPI00224BECA0|nr:probable sucrose-phosphate synthase 5 isoform X3 [Oryza glaberrima]
MVHHYSMSCPDLEAIEQPLMKPTSGNGRLIWYLQVEWEFSRQLSRRRLEQELGSREAAADLSELSEGEKDGKPDTHPPPPAAAAEAAADDGGGGDHQQQQQQPPPHQLSRFARINSDPRIVSDEEEEVTTDRNLYIVLISIHGLVRGENMELGRDSDTGGQVKYVVELARALAATPGVHRVDLLTRQISCPDVDWTYGEPVEMLTVPAADADDEDGGGGSSGGAYIVRLPCGPRDKYLPKESLWPHIPEFVDRALAHVTNVARALGEQLSPPPPSDGAGAAAQAVWPYVIHGHYADAAEVAALLASALNVPMVMTGHSLGRNKLEQLLKLGRMPRAEIQGTYKIARRIEAEETGLDAADMVVTSTKQEIEEQWGLYDGFDLKVERKLRVRRRRGVSCLGRYMPRMVVIPPGMDFSYVDTQDLAADGAGGAGDAADLQLLINPNKAKKPLPPIWSEVLRFFTNPHKPMILALSRPDPKKNVTTLLKAYGESRHLRELANLTLILGNRDDIEEMSGGAATVLTAVLKLIDRYDLYGQVAYPKHHKQTDVPHIYRLAAKTKGVFINPALVEPFGLTIIEAAAYGLPVVATKNGGPVDILKVLSNGLLVDPHDAAAITAALLSLLADKSRWSECRRSGLRNIHRFSWPHHCRLYLSHVAASCDHPAPHQLLRVPPSPSSSSATSAAAGGGGAAASSEPLSDSLRDLSLRISVDAASPDLSAGDSAAAILDALRRRRSTDRPAASSAARAIGFAPGRRQSLLVVAVDCYGDDGKPNVEQLKKVVELAMSAGDGDDAGGRGYVLSTGMTIPEAVDALRACGADPAGFDALICSSGAEICYPWKGEKLAADEEYAGHVAFRWPGDHVRSAVPRLGKADGAQEADLAVDAAACSVHCHAYAAKDASKVKKVDWIRQALRMRGFRCNLVYTRACTRLNVVPLSASRPRALRYLSIQWGIDLSKVAVLVGEKGDTDRERLLPGLHRTVILPGMVAAGSEELLRDEDGFTTEDVVAMDSPNIVTLADGQDIAAAAADLLKAI